jgi:hypothetical protein
MKFKFAILGLLLCLVTVSASTEPAGADESKGILQTAGEVFLKGSIDGKHMFMVLGMQDAAKATKEIIKWAVKGEDLVELGHDIYNGEHRDDLVDAVRDGARVSRKVAPHILKAPWKSLKKIPNAYRVNFDRAQDAYYGSSNSAVGVLKYSGWAVWANIEGAHYLVVEAPLVLAGSAVVTAAAVPAALAWQGLVIAWDAGCIAFKFTAGVAAIAVVNTYGIITSSAATVITLLAAGGVATFHGGKWLVYEIPRSFFHPVMVVNDTSFGYDQQERLAKIAGEVLSAWGSSELVRTRAKTGKYKSKLEGFVKDEDGDEYVAVTIALESRKGRVRIKADVSRKYYNLRRKASSDLSRKQVKSEIAGELTVLLQEIEARAATVEMVDGESALP